jgi:hypothetical protein
MKILVISLSIRFISTRHHLFSSHFCHLVFSVLFLLSLSFLFLAFFVTFFFPRHLLQVLANMIPYVFLYFDQLLSFSWLCIPRTLYIQIDFFLYKVLRIIFLSLRENLNLDFSSNATINTSLLSHLVVH